MLTPATLILFAIFALYGLAAYWLGGFIHYCGRTGKSPAPSVTWTKRAEPEAPKRPRPPVMEP